MSYNDDDKEVKIDEEDEDVSEEDPTNPLSDDPLEDDGLIGMDDDLSMDSEFAGLDGSEY